MSHISAIKEAGDTDKNLYEFSNKSLLSARQLKGGKRRETEGGGGHTDRMFCRVWTILQIGADSNRAVQKKVQHMAYLSGTLSPQPQPP